MLMTENHDSRNAGPPAGPGMLWIARISLCVSMIASVWCLGGYYPTGRFVSIALLAITLALTTFTPELFCRWRNRVPTILLVLCGIAVLGVTQLIPVASLTIESWETKTATSTAMIAIASLMLAWLLFQDDKARMLLLLALVVCGASQVCWAMMQQSSHRGEIFWGYEHPSHVMFGTFFNRNHAADFLGMSCASAVGLIVWYRAKFLQDVRGEYVQAAKTSVWVQPPMLALMLALLWLVIGLVATMSRAGWVTALLSVLAFSLVWKRKRNQAGKTRPGRKRIPRKRLLSTDWIHDRRAYGFIVVGLVTVITIAASLWGLGLAGRLNKRLSQVTVSRLLEDDRFDHWRQAVPVVSRYLPLGAGLGTYGYAHLPFTQSETGTWYTYAHNQYLQAVMEGGLPGGLIAIAIVLLGMNIVRPLCDSNRSPGKQAIGAASMLAVIMQSLHAFVDFGLAIPANSLTLSLVVGAAVSAQMSSRPSDSDKTFDMLSFSTSPARFASVVGLMMLPALVHLGQEARAEKIMVETEFSSETPGPNLVVTQRQIVELENAVQALPGCERLVRRLAQLQLHLSHRTRYEALRQRYQALADEKAKQADPLWDASSLAHLTYRLHVSSDSNSSPLTETERRQLENQLSSDPSLQRAWEGLQRSLGLNPLQPQSHLNLATIAAATGRPWRDHFDNASNLAGSNTKMSRQLGLAALTLGEPELMLEHWRRSVRQRPQEVSTFVRLSRRCVVDEIVVHELFPDDWKLPFRLAVEIKEEPQSEQFRQLLLNQAAELIEHGSLNKVDQAVAGIQVANQLGDHKMVAQWALGAVQSDPHNVNLRYQAAIALVKSQSLNEAMVQLRICVGLNPSELKYQQLLNRIQQLNR